MGLFRFWLAWGLIFEKRNRVGEHNCGDLVLACAEHYMLARAIVDMAPELYPYVTSLVLLYDGTKMSLNKLADLASRISPDLGQKIRNFASLGHCDTPTRPGPDSLRWGMKGANDGLLKRKSPLLLLLSL
jgi:hypothetical protein